MFGKRGECVYHGPFVQPVGGEHFAGEGEREAAGEHAQAPEYLALGFRQQGVERKLRGVGAVGKPVGW